MTGERHTVSPGGAPAPEAVDGDLLCLYYPQQVLPAFAAVATYRQRHGIDPERPVYAVLWNGAGGADDVQARRAAVVERLVAAFPWVRLWTPNQDERDRHLFPGRPVAAKAAFLGDQFRQIDVQAIFYPHDLTSDFLPQAMAQAFPRARRVCFGDGLGMVYSREYFERHMYRVTVPDAFSAPMLAGRHLLARLRRAWVAPRQEVLPPDAYVLILPDDPAGACVTSTKLLVVPYACAHETLTALTVAARSWIAPVATALGDTAVPVMLLGSFAESRMCSERQELQLYREVLGDHVPRGTRVVLKPHAATASGKVERLIRLIGHDYDALVFDRALSPMPIELFDGLLAGRRLLSFSYASVVLSYFDLARVMHVMTDDLIQRFFPRFIRPWMTDSNRSYLRQVEAAREARPTREATS